MAHQQRFELYGIQVASDENNLAGRCFVPPGNGWFELQKTMNALQYMASFVVMHMEITFHAEDVIAVLLQ